MGTSFSSQSAYSVHQDNSGIISLHPYTLDNIHHSLPMSNHRETYSYQSDSPTKTSDSDQDRASLWCQPALLVIPTTIYL
jgi:hypothetical protein